MLLTGLLCGFLLGFVMQRGRFCITGAFRDLYVTKSSRMFIALLIAITVQSIGIWVLYEAGSFTSPAESLPLLAVIIGAFLFGIGIIYAGGCATGTWYRAGEGLIGSWIALAMYMLFSSMMKYGALSGFQKSMEQYGRIHDDLAGSLGISVWWLVALLLVAVAYGVYRTLSNRPKFAMATLPPKYRGVRHWLFEKRYHPFTAAVVIGLIAFLAWVASSSTGRNGGLGITTPSADIVNFLVTGNEKRLNWGVFLVIGLFIGSYIAAKGSNEFRWRLPDLKTVYHSVVGGIAMGIGASLAGGCTIGNGLTATAVMSSKGWISLGFTILGAWTMAYFVFVRPQKQASSCSVA